MRVAFALVLVALAVTGCTSTAAPPPAAPTGPELVGPVSSQPGSCFFKDPAGKVFIAACP